MAEDREEAARAQQEREEQEARAANAGREAMIEMHRRRVQFAPGGPHDLHEQEEDSLYARSQPGASRRKLRSASAAASTSSTSGSRSPRRAAASCSSTTRSASGATRRVWRTAVGATAQ